MSIVAVVVTYRSAIAKAKKGGFKVTLPEEYFLVMFRAHLYPHVIEEVIVGNVLTPGGGVTQARLAIPAADIPNSAAVNIVNSCGPGRSTRSCSRLQRSDRYSRMSRTFNNLFPHFLHLAAIS